jgi:hypothetical protein
MNAKSVKTNNSSIEIAILIFFTIMAFFLWDTIFIYPIKLFVVLLHEVAHGIMAVVTGGSIVKIEIDPRIGGVCYTAGGIQFLVASAGYIGSIFLGGWIFLLASKNKSARFLSFLLIIIILCVTVFFIRNTFGFVFGIVFALGLFLITRLAPDFILQYLLKFIGLVSCFYVLIDIKEDLFTTEFRGSDADAIAKMTGIGSIYWAIIWIIIAIAAFIFFLRKSIKK